MLIQNWLFIVVLVIPLFTQNCGGPIHDTAIAALADDNTPVTGKDLAFINSLHILQVQNISDGKVLLYTLSPAKVGFEIGQSWDIAITRVQQNKRGWTAVESEVSRVLESEHVTLLKSTLGQADPVHAVYGFSRIPGVVNVKWMDGQTSQISIVYGAFLVTNDVGVDTVLFDK